MTFRPRTGPLRLDQSVLDVAMNGRIRPIDGPPDEPVLDRIDPAISDMGFEVGWATDVMLPEPALPNPALFSDLMARPQRPSWHIP